MSVFNTAAKVMSLGTTDGSGGGALSDLWGGLTGKTGAKAAREAAQIQAAAAEKAMQQQARYMEPYFQSGMQAQNRLMSLLGLSGDTAAPEYGSMARNFGMADFQADPGYAFRMSEGLKALERSAAGRGGAASGAAMKGITKYGQDLASQEYQNAYNRYQTNRANLLNPLFNIAGTGRAAAGSLGNIYGQGITDVGSAQASGLIGSTNAQQQGIQNLLNIGALAAGSMGGTPGVGAGMTLPTLWAGGGGGTSSYGTPGAGRMYNWLGGAGENTYNI